VYLSFVAAISALSPPAPQILGTVRRQTHGQVRLTHFPSESRGKAALALEIQKRGWSEYSDSDIAAAQSSAGAAEERMRSDSGTKVFAMKPCKKFHWFLCSVSKFGIRN